MRTEKQISGREGSNFWAEKLQVCEKNEKICVEKSHLFVWLKKKQNGGKVEILSEKCKRKKAPRFL